MMNKEHITSYFKLLTDTVNSIDKDAVAVLRDAILDCYNREGTIYIFGNGGSGSTASHVAGDYVKGASMNLQKRFRMICLNDNICSMMAISNDSTYDDIFVEPLKNFLRKEDLVIGISGSGNSRNVIKGLTYAKEKGAKTAAISAFKGGEIKKIADIACHVEVMDMEVAEDAHLIIFHAVKQDLINILHKEPINLGPEYQKRIAE